MSWTSVSNQGVSFSLEQQRFLCLSNLSYIQECYHKECPAHLLPLLVCQRLKNAV